MCGEYDLHVMLAMRYGWRPEQVNEMNPAFLDELLAAINAKAKKDKKDAAEAEAKAGRK